MFTLMDFQGNFQVVSSKELSGSKQLILKGRKQAWISGGEKSFKPANSMIDFFFYLLLITCFVPQSWAHSFESGKKLFKENKN